MVPLFENLVKYILEDASPEEQVEFCQTQIDNAPETKKIIKKMYNAATGEANAFIKAWLEKKHMSKDQVRCVLGLFLDYDQLDMLVEIAANDGLIKSEDILNSSSGEIKTMLKNATKDYDIQDELIDELIATQPGQGGVTVGPAEIALMIFVKKCTQNNTKKSDEPDDAEEAEEVGADLKIANKGVEIKGQLAMLMGQGIEVNPKSYINASKKDYKITPVSAMTKLDPKLIEICQDAAKLSKYVQDTMPEYIAPGNPFFEPYYKWLANGKVTNFKDFALSLALYSLQVYQSKEGFHKIMLINTNNKKSYPYLMLSFEGKGKSDIDSLWENCKGKIDPKTFINAQDKRTSIPKVTYTGTK